MMDSRTNLPSLSITTVGDIRAYCHVSLSVCLTCTCSYLCTCVYKNAKTKQTTLAVQTRQLAIPQQEYYL